MNTIKMIEFGPILTGRDFGQKTMKELAAKIQHPVTLDFSGTISMGSSFGDEIIPPIAKQQGGEITVINANPAVQSCLQLIADGNGIKINHQRQ